MLEEDETGSAVHVGGQSARAVKLSFHRLTRSFPEVGDDSMRDFLVTAHAEAVRIQVTVRTWNGDGLDVFLAGLAEDFRGWNGARTWRSLEHDLTLSAEHAGSYVQLMWGLHNQDPDDEWRFQVTTVHAPGEDMRNLTIEMRAFLESEPLE